MCAKTDYLPCMAHIKGLAATSQVDRLDHKSLGRHTLCYLFPIIFFLLFFSLFCLCFTAFPLRAAASMCVIRRVCVNHVTVNSVFALFFSLYRSQLFVLYVQRVSLTNECDKYLPRWGAEAHIRREEEDKNQ